MESIECTLYFSSYCYKNKYVMQHEPFGCGIESFAAEPSPASVVSSTGAGLDILPFSSSPAVEVISKNHIIQNTRTPLSKV